jgi:hypothetical protein
MIVGVHMIQHVRSPSSFTLKAIGALSCKSIQGNIINLYTLEPNLLKGWKTGFWVYHRITPCWIKETIRGSDHLYFNRISNIKHLARLSIFYLWFTPLDWCLSTIEKTCFWPNQRFKYLTVSRSSPTPIRINLFKLAAYLVKCRKHASAVLIAVCPWPDIYLRIYIKMFDNDMATSVSIVICGVMVRVSMPIRPR